MVEKILRKIYRTIFPLQKPTQTPVNIKKGDAVIVDPSSILMTFKTGEIIFEGKNYIGRQVEIGTEGLVKIGTGTTIQDRCILLGDIEIGKYCTFASNVYMSSGRHYYDHKPYFYIRDQDEIVNSDVVLSKQHSQKIIIGDDVWLGINCVIMSGIKIGRGAVIGSNSVVTKDVEPFTVVGGIPAKFIKNRLEFSPKNSLNFDNDQDLPNFYKGFFIDLKNVISDRKNLGISAGNSFTLFLSKEGKKVRLEIKKIIAQPLKLMYNGQSADLTNEFTEIVFHSANDNFHHFVMDLNTKSSDEKLILVKKVNVIS